MTDVKVKKSPELICQHQNRRDFFRSDNYKLYECLDCHLVFREPNDADLNPSLLYEGFYKQGTAQRFNRFVEYAVRILHFFRALMIFTVMPRAKSVLDIGSGRGYTLYYLRKYFRFRRAAGTQISQPALEFSRNVLGLEIYGEDLLKRSWNNDSFDVITLWHVLEHLVKPEEYIVKIYDLLNKNGKLIIEVPNLASWSYRWAGKYWLGLDLKHHLSFFSPLSLQAMLKRHNFHIETVNTFSLEYSTFFSAQSIISRITKTEHTFFRRLQGEKFPLQTTMASSVLMFALAPICLLVNVLLIFTQKGEVVFVVAKKNG